MESFRKYGTWWIILAMVGVVLAGTANGDDAARMAGSLVGLFLASWILAGLAWFAGVVVRRRLSTLQYMYTFTVAFVIVAVLSLVGSQAR